MSESIEELEQKLGYTFKNGGLLRQALTHTSYANEKYNTNAHLKSNERLEFVGDAIVGLIVAEYLYKANPDFSEGNMSRLRSAVVCEATLSLLAENLGVPACLKLGIGEYRTGGKHKASLLADAMESIVAAVFLDSDFDTVKAVMLPHFEKLAKNAAEKIINGDHKSKLQEKMAARGERVSYEIINSFGPSHDMVFVARVTAADGKCATGEGRSKREAEQAAAGKLLEIID